MQNENLLTEAFLAKIAGWEAMKRARDFLAAGAVLSSNWTPPVLKGVVRDGATSYRAGLVIKDAINLENLCRCRDSSRWGTICAHSVAVGLHHLRGASPIAAPRPLPAAVSPSPSLPDKSGKTADKNGAGNRYWRRWTEAGSGGEDLELAIILPPNFSQAVEKGKIMIWLEGRWRDGRAPLNAVPRSRAFQLSKPDALFLEATADLARGEVPGLIQVDNSQFAALLPKLIDHPRVTLGKTQPVTIEKTPWKLPVLAKLESSGEIGLTIRPGNAPPCLLPGEQAWIFGDLAFRPLGLPKAYWALLNGPLQLARHQVPQFLGQDWPAFQEHCDLQADFKMDDFIFEPQAPRFYLGLAGGLAQLQAQLQCAYGPRIMTLGVTSGDETLWLPDPQCLTRYSTRDLAAEQAAQARLIRAGFRGPNAQGQFEMAGQNSVLNFFARDYPRLQKEWEVTLEERLQRSTSLNLERVEPHFQVRPSGEQWFDLEINYATTSGEPFPAAEIQRLLRGGQHHQRLKNGRFALIDTGAVEELEEVVRDCAPEQHAQGFRLPNVQAAFLTSTLREQPGGHMRAPASWLEQIQSLPSPALSLGELEAVLRPYQKQGVGWLHSLRRNGFGGILADEMGLGKTLQALAFFQSLKKDAGDRDNDPILVICPTSLVFNWMAEAQRFTPNLRLLAIEGPARQELFRQIPQYDVVVTSYALLRRDAEVYRDFTFDVVVLDEAQHIKNRQTQNALTVKAIQARQRLVLTGTPMENSVLDLWSIFDFLMPGYLGSANEFRERYEIPISREKDAPTQVRLARRLRPFLLRRLKRDVAPELPAKLEQIAYCELSGEQASIYRQVLEASRQEIVEAVGSQGLAKSRLVVFTALLRLRQICCDLRLLKMEQAPAAGSGKFDLFCELLEEVLDGGHRVLVFSQFVSMLSLLKAQLTTEGVEYCYLDGSTPDRGKEVGRFQNSGQIPVFLISLKAGGVGLNLTGADTVIHYDPWWNPAVEDQATERTHRLGQTRVVTSYKLITRGTVEEKILNLQSRKREMIAAALGAGGELSDALTWEEIQDLLRD